MDAEMGKRVALVIVMDAIGLDGQKYSHGSIMKESKMAMP
jgi:hypothetical protein